MAHLSGDESLIAAFAHGEDIHAATAAKLFNKTLGEVTSEERRRAKTANFGIIYGISAFGLSQRLEIPRKEAKEIIDGYFASYPKVQEYMDNVVAKAKEEGFVSTIFGRRRYLNDIASHNAIARGLAERNAVNAPIQGSAADIMKIAMINVHRRFAAEGIRSKVILQVHDELVVDMLRSEQERVVAIVTEAHGVRCRAQSPSGGGLRRGRQLARSALIGISDDAFCAFISKIPLSKGGFLCRISLCVSPPKRQAGPVGSGLLASCSGGVRTIYRRVCRSC